MARNVSFPSPREDDQEDVHWALTTATSLHSRGDTDEALRWLRKAVAVAVACDLDARAIELGRLAADIEESLGAASTQRGQKDRLPDTDAALRRPLSDEMTERSVVRHPRESFSEHDIDGLDDPTHVDSSRSASSLGAPTMSSPAPTTLQDGTPATPRGDQPMDSEPTLVPFTKMSPGTAQGLRAVTSRSADARDAPTAHSPGTFRRVDGKTLQIDPPPPSPGGAKNFTATMPAYAVFEDDEATIAMVQPEREDALPPPMEATMPAMNAVTRYRVAMLASSDSHEPRVIWLGNDAPAPSGAGVAVLVPMSSADAQVIAALLSPTKRRGR